MMQAVHGRPREVLAHIDAVLGRRRCNCARCRSTGLVSCNITVHEPPPFGPGPLSGGGMWPPMAMQISQAEQDHHAVLRRRSYELAIERGHLRR